MLDNFFLKRLLGFLICSLCWLSSILDTLAALFQRFSHPAIVRFLAIVFALLLLGVTLSFAHASQSLVVLLWTVVPSSLFLEEAIWIIAGVFSLACAVAAPVAAPVAEIFFFLKNLACGVVAFFCTNSTPVANSGASTRLADIDLSVSTDCEDLAIFAADVLEFVQQDQFLAFDALAEFLPLGAIGAMTALSLSGLGIWASKLRR